ncbi:MAG TPA: hypothetical protein VGK90_05600, partial [Rhizomicrobium sp.]
RPQAAGWGLSVSTLRKYQAFLIIAVLAAPAGLALTWFVPPFWSNIAAVCGLLITLVSVLSMALLRCPHCRHQLGLGEAAHEFHSHCCPRCGTDLRS